MRIWIGAALAALGLAGPVAAQDLMGSYTAFVGIDDLYNSKGQSLDSAAQILRQDRANFHKFGLSQPGDEWDPFFHDPAARARMEALLEESLTQPTRSAIRAGNVYVIVAVYGYDGYISFLRVVVPE